MTRPSSNGNARARVSATLVFACVIALVLCGVAGCRGGPKRTVRIFHAAGATALLEKLREPVLRDLGIELKLEGSGSQVAARKVTELGRTCDVIVLADADLVARMLSDQCSWRIDFATDAMVLAVGVRAPGVDDAEADWASVVTSQGRLARVDEVFAPVGYRTLFVWELADATSHPGIAAALRDRTDVVVEDVGRLMPLLKTGQADYAFAYRSTCLASDVRYIELDPAINLSDPDIDYRRASVSATLPNGKTMTFSGQPIIWTLTIPRSAEQPELARELVGYLISRSDLMREVGFTPIEPARRMGASDDENAIEGTVYGGPMR